MIPSAQWFFKFLRCAVVLLKPDSLFSKYRLTRVVMYEKINELCCVLATEQLNTFGPVYYISGFFALCNPTDRQKLLTCPISCRQALKASRAGLDRLRYSWFPLWGRVLFKILSSKFFHFCLVVKYCPTPFIHNYGCLPIFDCKIIKILERLSKHLRSLKRSY